MYVCCSHTHSKPCYNVYRCIIVQFENDGKATRQVAAGAVIAWPLPPAPKDTVVHKAAAWAGVAAAAAAARRTAALQQRLLQQQLADQEPARQQELEAYEHEAQVVAQALPDAEQAFLQAQRDEQLQQQRDEDAYANPLESEGMALFGGQV